MKTTQTVYSIGINEYQKEWIELQLGLFFFRMVYKPCYGKEWLYDYIFNSCNSCNYSAVTSWHGEHIPNRAWGRFNCVYCDYMENSNQTQTEEIRRYGGSIQSLLSFRKIYMGYYGEQIAQLGEQLIRNQQVVGSNPTLFFLESYKDSYVLYSL